VTIGCVDVCPAAADQGAVADRNGAADVEEVSAHDVAVRAEPKRALALHADRRAAVTWLKSFMYAPCRVRTTSSTDGVTIIRPIGAAAGSSRRENERTVQSRRQVAEQIFAPMITRGLISAVSAALFPALLRATENSRRAPAA